MLPIDLRRYQPQERIKADTSAITALLPSLIGQFLAAGGKVEQIPYGTISQDKLAKNFSINNHNPEDTKPSKASLEQAARARQARFDLQGVK